MAVNAFINSPTIRAHFTNPYGRNNIYYTNKTQLEIIIYLESYEINSFTI